ncbi:DUF998 domain-containing protein [Microbacterium resistens]|uniref:DUF998 domain-containing protein n=1 Tax=Microbacterium resistens TaxID=156977 RepID=UPI001C571CB0|nr:DUF998 domain-containing protein [Microbacterium resistens]MBW1637701.1 DUF998 domain-containing protein [Microbacterium resistens]
MDRTRLTTAGVLLLAGVQYFLAEAITAAAWTRTPYSYGENYISDLGVPECVELGRTVCSPAYLLMDVSFVLQGLLVLTAVIVLGDALRAGRPHRIARMVVAVLAVVHAIGLITVGLFPGSFAEAIGGDPVRLFLHSLGALFAILGGNLLMVAVAVLAPREGRPVLALAIAVLAVIGLGAIAAGLLGSDLGLGLGGIERLAAYPVFAGLFLVGGALIVAGRRSRGTPVSEKPLGR